MNKIQTKNRNSATKLVIKAKALAKRGDTSDAKEILNDFLSNYPGNKYVRKLLNSLTEQQTPACEDEVEVLEGLFKEAKYEEVIKEGGKLVSIDRKNAVVWNLIGAAASNLGLLDKASNAFEEAIRIAPSQADALNNLGYIRFHQGEYSDSVQLITKAIASKPEYPEAYNNLGNTLAKIGELEESIICYQKALEIRPSFMEVHNNIGNVFLSLGKHEDSITCFENYLLCDRSNPEVYYKLSEVLDKVGKKVQAFRACKAALALAPDYEQARKKMAQIMSGITFSEPDVVAEDLLIAFLTEERWTRPSRLMPAGISLIKLHHGIRPLLIKGFLLDTQLEPCILIEKLATARLLNTLMQNCPLNDLDLEELLRQVRRFLLLNLDFLEGNQKVLELRQGLALQCFINEYIYNDSDQEVLAVNRLEHSVSKSLANGVQPRPQDLLSLASYRALTTMGWVDQLLPNKDIELVFNQQVIEPKIELELRNQIKAVTGFKDEISQLVRNQYESNPYPRWVSMQLEHEPTTLQALIDFYGLSLSDDKIRKIGSPKILIAGCGTGQQSIEVARTFSDCSVTAIDLSLSSLAYAKRKSEELGLTNIKYVHGDILELAEMKSSFDYIECVGVLNHLREPILGWASLLKTLKAEGIMKIGLYSSLARTQITAMRNKISNDGIRPTAEEMRIFRNEIIDEFDQKNKLFIRSQDFFSLSMFRDLLFHAQEHCFTLHQIRGMLEKLNLKFCGFDTSNLDVKSMQQELSASDIQNFSLWEKYEEAHPETFRGMYQFWCQKT